MNKHNLLKKKYKVKRGTINLIKLNEGKAKKNRANMCENGSGSDYVAP